MATRTEDGIALGPDTTIIGNDNRVTHARDIIFHLGSDDFFALDLDSVSLTTAPRILSELVSLAVQRRLLVLGGDYEDKATVARQVGRRAAQASSDAVLPLIEWSRGSDYHGLLLGLRKKTDPAVILLTGILPHQVGYDVMRLREAALTSGHVLIVATDCPLAAWPAREEVAYFWRELDADGLFDESVVVSELVERLGPVRATLPEGSVVEAPSPDQATLGGVSFRVIAARLRTPATVEVFVQQLAARAGEGDAPVDAEGVEALVVAATSGGMRVEKWFHGVLSPAEQLLALALSIFDGLPDDQLFAALERWVAHIRAHRDPAVRAFDYADLATLEGFFAPVSGEEEERRYESRWPGLRQNVFRAAWRTHRRQLLGALDVLVDLAAESAGTATDWELYGSEGRRARLRRAVAATLTDLGLLSVPAVEPALLALASDEELEVQKVAAEAVSRWRLHGDGARLFELLDRWQDDARIRATVEALLEGKDEKKTRGPLEHLRATIALAVGYAAEHDAPGHLTPELVRLVEKLADDPNVLVRERFAGFTLPRAVALHLSQLRGPLREMAFNPELARAVGGSLAYAYGTLPDEVAETLNAWHLECEHGRLAPRRSSRPTQRDRLLTALAHAYGDMELTADGRISAHTAFARLKHMLETETHPKVREAVVSALLRQARGRLEQVEGELRTVLGGVRPDERRELVGSLTRLYLDQRAAQEGGTDEIEVNGRFYRVWLNGGRPLTQVERVMLRWMKSPGFPAAQRIAFGASVNFARVLDEVETRKMERLREERRRRRAAAEAARGPVETLPAQSGEGGWYTGAFVPWLATLSADQQRRVVATLLPEAVAQKGAAPSAVNLVLDRWRRMESDRGTAILAGRLRAALDWWSSAWIFPVVGVLVFIFLLIAIF